MVADHRVEVGQGVDVGHECTVRLYLLTIIQLMNVVKNSSAPGGRGLGEGVGAGRRA